MELCVFFFVKQKTAYEMRISDWSSDVCSSDLFGSRNDRGEFLRQRSHIGRVERRRRGHLVVPQEDFVDAAFVVRSHAESQRLVGRDLDPVQPLLTGREIDRQRDAQLKPFDRHRSEEHTSELQSLMRNSYAVFCLKKKKT